MAHFTQALKTVIDRSFGGKIAALASPADMHGPEIGRLLREEAPLTSDKLVKLLTACENEADRTLLAHAAIRDFVGESMYQQLFPRETEGQANVVNADLGGPSFKALFPIHPRAEQVLRYLVNNVQSSTDIEQGLIIFGNMLELPPPLTEEPITTGAQRILDAQQRIADQIREAGESPPPQDQQRHSA